MMGQNGEKINWLTEEDLNTFKLKIQNDYKANEEEELSLSEVEGTSEFIEKIEDMNYYKDLYNELHEELKNLEEFEFSDDDFLRKDFNETREALRRTSTELNNSIWRIQSH